MFKNVYLIGVGLINASLAKDLKREHLANKIIGIGRDRARLQSAQLSEIIDEYQVLPNIDVSDADLIVVGVPVGKIKQSFEQIKPTLSSDATITDVGSSKVSVLTAAQDVFGEVPKNLVPGHPIAGSELSGFENAFEHLFNNRKVILTPAETTSDKAVTKIKHLWERVGAKIDVMSAAQHDAILSATSHLPHMVAYSLVNYLGQREDADSIFKYAAGGFYDFTRIASSDPTMWTDICIENKDEIIKSIDGFIACLAELKAKIAKQDESAIHAIFLQAKQLRNKNLNN